MDTVTILRDLWRYRVLVVGVYLVAMLAGLAVVYKISFPPKLESRKYTVGIAQARILLDTPSSQVVDVAAKGSDSLGVRANLIASLMVDGVVEKAIAERAGLPPDKLVGVTDTAAEPSPVTSKPGPRDFVLTTKVVTNTGGDQLPIIEVDAQAPDRVGAARLAAAAVAGLRDYLDSKAALQQVQNADRLQVTGLGAPVAATEVRGPGNVLAVIVVIFVFALGCAAILGALALARGWRAASERELLVVEPNLFEDVTDDDGYEEHEPRSAPDPVGEHPPAPQGQPDNWLAPARPTLLVPSADEGRSIERDQPQAKSA